MEKYIKGLTLSSPASLAEIAQISQVERLPRDYVAFMTRSNGAEGPIGKTYLAIFSVSEMVETNNDLHVEPGASGLVFFGSNRASAMYCFDLRTDAARIVKIDLMDIGFEEPRYRSNTFTGFLQFLALSDDPWS